MEIIEIKEDVVIKQEDGDILLEEGDKVKILSEGIDSTEVKDPVAFLKKIGYEFGSSIFIKNVMVNTKMGFLSFSCDGTPFGINLRSGDIVIRGKDSALFTMGPSDLSRCKLYTHIDNKEWTFNSITIQSSSNRDDTIVIYFSNKIPHELWKDMHSTTRGGVSF